jgi:hypothetical protein
MARNSDYNTTFARNTSCDGVRDLLCTAQSEKPGDEFEVRLEKHELRRTLRDTAWIFIQN